MCASQSLEWCVRRAWLVAGALLALALVAAATDGKRAESEFMSPMPFVLGSRYGRSQPRVISPRNDRFFMSSRYGKRSEPAVAAPTRLLCTPLGIRALYRCAPAPVPASAIARERYRDNDKRSEEERDIGEEE